MSLIGPEYILFDSGNIVLFNQCDSDHILDTNHTVIKFEQDFTNGHHRFLSIEVESNLTDHMQLPHEVVVNLTLTRPRKISMSAIWFKFFCPTIYVYWFLRASTTTGAAC